MCDEISETIYQFTHIAINIISLILPHANTQDTFAHHISNVLPSSEDNASVLRQCWTLFIYQY